jgi:TonB family protein
LFLIPSETIVYHQLAVVSVLLLTCLPAACERDAQDVSTTGTTPIAPLLLPQVLTISTPKHCDELDGIVKFAATVDANGFPQGLKTLEASDRRLVNFATKLVEAQRFKPGTIYGSNTAVPVELTVGLHTCAQREKHPTDGDFYRFTLRAHPLFALAVVAAPAVQEIVPAPPTEAATAEQVEGQISAPIPTVLIDPAIPVSGKLPKRGACLVGVTIDANGLPQNIHVVRNLDPELDNNAIEAVKNWRFKAALRDGSDPVAVAGTIEATFEYVDKEPVAFATFVPETPEAIQAAIALHGRKRPNLEPVNADEVIARYMPVSRVPGRCLVSLLVDTNGVPQNVHIVKGLDSGVDADTVAMVEHLRFKPVTLDGTTPVTVGLIVPVRYRTTVQKPTWRDVFFDLAEIPILFFL